MKRRHRKALEGATSKAFNQLFENVLSANRRIQTPVNNQTKVSQTGDLKISSIVPVSGPSVTIESVTPSRKGGKVLGAVTRFTVVGINTHHCNTCGSSKFALLTSVRSFQPDLNVVVCDRCGETENLPDSLRSVAQSVLDALNGAASHE